MRIGVVGDTHNNLKSVRRIVEIFDHTRVDRVIHTGDITQAKVLDLLGTLEAPVYGVWGNNDLEQESLQSAARTHSMNIVEGPLELNWCDRRIVVVHDPRDLAQCLSTRPALALHGHTHLFRFEHCNGTLIFNPGECAGMLPGYNRVGLVDLETLHCEVQYF
ncbi:MAG: YfcE family phosphodiesterase [Myxococcota bacterium]|nr:YfcE family phosphodiesterase [Myxococcota bacterium]